MKQPDWIDKPPSQWPPEARIAFGILATIAERRLRRIQSEQQAQEAESKTA